MIKNYGPKNPPPGRNLGPKFPPHVGRSPKKIWKQFHPYIKMSMSKYISDDFDCRLFPGRQFELQIPSFVLSNSIGRSSVPIAISKIGIAHRLARAVGRSKNPGGIPLLKYSHLSNNRGGWNKHVEVQKLQNQLDFFRQYLS